MNNPLRSLFVGGSLLAITAVVGAQNPNCSSYFTYTYTANADGSYSVTPTAEITGTDDPGDWVEGSYRPLCNTGSKAQVTGDANWVQGPAVSLGHTLTFVHTGQAITVPADGSIVHIQYAVEADTHCSKPPNPEAYIYPSLHALSTWSDIDPDTWFLDGFSPVQTEPPVWVQACPSPLSCPVDSGTVASVTNFVDYADFGDITVGIKVTYGQNTLGSQVIGSARFCGYTPKCTNTTQPACGNSWTQVGVAENPCSTYSRGSFLKITISGVASECVGPSFPASGPGECSQ